MQLSNFFSTVSAKFPRLPKAPTPVRAWVWELWSLVGALALFATLVVLLFVFDRQPVFQWYGVTLNTIVAVISTTFKALLLYSIAECVGQWKWILFREERELMDFERLDQATRGPVGSFLLLRRKGIPWRLRLGVFLLILGLAVDPFSQQLIQLELSTKWARSLGEGRATSPRAHAYKEGNIVINHNATGPDGPFVAEISLSMQAAILDGLSQSRESSQQKKSNVQCPTSNCTWEPFKTLGICHRCNNLTPELRKVDNFTKVFMFLGGPLDNDTFVKRPNPLKVTALTLPNGHFMANLDGCNLGPGRQVGCNLRIGAPDWSGTTADDRFTAMTSFGTGDPNKTNSMGELDTMIWSTSIIHPENASLYQGHSRGTNFQWPHSPVRATECALYYCVKSIASRVENNIIIEDESFDEHARRHPDSWKLNEYYGVPQEAWPPNPHSLEFDKVYGYIPRDDLSFYGLKRPNRPEFNISATAILSISSFFQQTFRGSPWKGQHRALELVRERIPNATVFMNGVIKPNDANPRMISLFYGGTNNSMESQFEALARSMTNEVRLSGQRGSNPIQLFDPFFVGEPEPIEPQVGWIGISITVYMSEWYWIILHGLLLCSSAVFCIMTVFHPGGEPQESVWKNHSLAAIRQGAISDHRLENTTTVHEMEKMALRETTAFLPTGSKASSHGEWEDHSTRDPDIVEETTRLGDALDTRDEVSDLSDSEQGATSRQVEEGRSTRLSVLVDEDRRIEGAG